MILELNPTIVREFNHLKSTPLIAMGIDKGKTREERNKLILNNHVEATLKCINWMKVKIGMGVKCRNGRD